MGNKNIKKEEKKKKTSNKPVVASTLKSIVTPQPEIIKKPKKDSE